MAPNTKKWIDKKSATTFQVRYRSQNDPLIHDENASEYVLTQVDAPNSHSTPSAASSTSSKIKTTSDLERELDVGGIRKNEGEAAMYGIYFDDSSYDYMQHLRDVGTAPEAVFIEAPQSESKQNKRKGKQTLDQALKGEDEVLPPKSKVITIPKELLPSEKEVKRTYQDMQDVPDALRGFQPDMDPRLREVLEALENEAYVDDDEGLFEKLAEGGEADANEFEAALDDDDEGWQSDTTEKQTERQDPGQQEAEKKDEAGAGDGQHDWMKEFGKFKKAQKKAGAAHSEVDTLSFGGSSIMTSGTASVSARRRKREKKAAKAGTATSGYSMTSSSLCRTEGLTLLDDRFDRIEEEYNQEDSEEDEEGDQPRVPKPETRQDFDRILDEFLGEYKVTGKKSSTVRVRKGKYQTGMEQLDEIRTELGRTWIR